VVTEAPLWTVVLVPPLLGALALAGAAGNAALDARAAGWPPGPAMAWPLRETARLLTQQRRQTTAADRLLWRSGGAAVVAAAALAAAVLPLGTRVVVDLPVGVVWFNAMEVVAWGALWLVGWGANSVYGLVGGYRFVAQGLAYELPHMLALITAALAAGSLRMGDVAAAQSGLWFAVWMPVAFVVFLVSALAMAFSPPFDQPTSADIAGGVLAELSGVDRLVFLAGRYLLLAAAAAAAVPLFLGGGAGPLLPAWLWSLLKTLAVLGLLVGARHRMATLRMDRFEEVAWMVLVPAVLVQALVVAIVVLARR